MKSIALVLLAACSSPAARPQPATPRPTPAVAPQATLDSRQPSQSGVIDDVAAHIGTDVITIAMLDRYVDIWSKYEIDRQTDPAMREYVRARERFSLLPELIDEELLHRAATRARIEVSDRDVTAALDEVKRVNNLTDQQLTKEVLVPSGRSIHAFREDLRRQLRIARYLSTRTMPNETHEQRRTRVTAELRANAKVVIAISKPIAPELPRMLDAQAVATTEDIEAALGRKLPEYAIKRIAHDFYSPTYDSIHFEAIDKPETNDIAVSVWKLSGDALDKQFKELQRLPNVELRHELADDSLRSRSNEAFGHAFIDRKASVVGFVICGRAICKKPEEALTIAKLVRSRLDKLTTGEPAL